MNDTINPAFWIDAIRGALHCTDCAAKPQTLTNAADHLERYIAALATPTAREPVKVTDILLNDALGELLGGMSFANWKKEVTRESLVNDLQASITLVLSDSALTAALGQQDGKSGSESGQKACADSEDGDA